MEVVAYENIIALLVGYSWNLGLDRSSSKQTWQVKITQNSSRIFQARNLQSLQRIYPIAMFHQLEGIG